MIEPDKIILWKEGAKAEYLRIALALQDVSVELEMADRIAKTFELILHKGDAFTIKDSISIDSEIKEKYSKEKLKK